MSNNTTFNAKIVRNEIANKICDMALELEDYDGYICDAISEIADSNVSIYTADNIAFCREHSDDVRDALMDELRDAYDEEIDGHTPYIEAVNDDE